MAKHEATGCIAPLEDVRLQDADRVPRLCKRLRKKIGLQRDQRYVVACVARFGVVRVKGRRLRGTKMEADKT